MSPHSTRPGTPHGTPVTVPGSWHPRGAVFVAGQWRDGHGGDVVVDDPATAQVLATLKGADAADVTAAADAAQAAGAAWAATAPRRRSEILRAVFEAMHARSDEIAELITAENGKSLADSLAEVTYAAEFFRWFSEEAVRTHGGFGVAPAGGTRTLVQSRPVGVAALVTPWNFPAAMVTRKIAPALAAGCTVVVKPPAETPLTSLFIAELIDDVLRDAGMEAGIVNVVPSDDSAMVGTTLLAHPDVRKISFTGSTRVGRILLAQAAERIVNSSMELGGNAPFVVTDTADVDAAVAGAMIAKFRNGGQACTAANRFHVHRDVHDEFVEKFAARIAALNVGPGASGAEIGPMVSAKARDSIAEVVDAAVADGARIHTTAPVPEGAGYWYPPTLLTGVSPDAAIVQHELFGPVAPVIVFDDVEEMIAHANSTEMGLAGYVYDRDLARAMRIAERLEIGMIGINRGLVSDPAAPFGGTKQSGLGREGAREGMDAFLETQYLSIAWE
ncbi:NAD-dependent succinate-semialdehyde dehydrogenase [Nocardioides yefusunii]|uniref:NAD-dependent succinate-semialdehyde dehydrogenase n=1 Tax=Nocardioides yefusunii TaxID=2500546 RepID=A0ABW1QSX9_9ACTN|nr:NAD-dependent succinate-semialdehyde dehydrogenase [Nocardioides yefusunii]